MTKKIIQWAENLKWSAYFSKKEKYNELSKILLNNLKND